MQMLRTMIGRLTGMSRTLIDRPLTNASPDDAEFRIDTADHSLQTITPPGDRHRFEGIAFSPSGQTIGIAAPDTNTLFLFRRKADGRFEDEPYSTISGPASGLNYPHDVSFASSGDSEMLAVAQRTGSICIYEKKKGADDYGSTPVWEIRGAEAKLIFSDAVAFVPPDNEYLAACNLSVSKLTFYRKVPGESVRFTSEPVFELEHPSISQPDGLAFSSCGQWLAIANHGANTVTIFERQAGALGPIQYGPEPVTVINDPSLRYAHSVAFTPNTNHLVVTSAGANYFSVYAPERDASQVTRWSQTSVLRHTVGPDRIFRKVNARNKMEGGPKGVAVHDNNLAVCRPEQGLKIYSFSAGSPVL